MTRNKKIIIGVVAGILVLCLAVCGVGFFAFRNFTNQIVENAADSPEEAATMGKEIADFDLPAGYAPQTGINVMGVKMVFYSNSAKSNNVIMLMQMPMEQELSESEFEQLRSQMERQSGRRMENVQTLDDRSITVRGKPGRVVLQEGVDSDGETTRQLLAAFSGKNGLAMLMIVGPADNWDQTTYDKMISTIR